MRILVLTQYFLPEAGASQARLAGMVRELVRRGHEVEVVTCFPHYAVGRIYPGVRSGLYSCTEWEGVRVHRTWVYPATGAGFKRYVNFLSFAGTSPVGLRCAKRPDVLFIEFPPLPLALTGLLAAGLRRVPTVLNVSDMWSDAAIEFGLLKPGVQALILQRLEAWAYRQATRVCAVTAGIRDRLIQEKGLPPNKLMFLPNGVDTELLRPLPPDRRLMDELGLRGKTIFMYAGTVGYSHAADAFIRAARLVSDPSVHFLFVGGGSSQSDLEQLARQLMLNNVTFLPPVALEQMARFYSVAYCGLVSVRNSRVMTGARPAKMLAIMACGKPVLYSGEGEGAQMVEQAGAGIVVRKGDPAQLAEAIRTMAADASRARDFGGAGREYVVKQLTWAALIEKWLRELNNVCSDERVQMETDFGPI